MIFDSDGMNVARTHTLEQNNQKVILKLNFTFPVVVVVVVGFCFRFFLLSLHGDGDYQIE